MFGGGFLDHFAFVVAGAGKFTVRILGTAQEAAVFAETIDHCFPALGTLVFAGLGLGLGVNHFLFGVFEAVAERRIKFLQDADPFKVLIFDLVKLLFHVTGEGNIHHLREEFIQFVGDNLADLRGKEFFVLFFHVLAILNRGDNRGIRAGSSDPLFFEGLDQGCFRIAGRRLGEMLLGVNP